MIVVFFRRAIVILLSFFCIACNDREVVNAPMELQVPLGIGKANVSEYFEEIEYLRLVGKDGQLYPTRVDQIEFLGDDVLILDKSLNVIFMFDQNGNLTRVLDRKGGGPEEYLYLHRFLVDNISGIIEVYDKVGQKILTFDRNFNFISSVRVNLFFQDFLKLNNGTYVFYLAQENQYNDSIVKKNLVLWGKGGVKFTAIEQLPTDRFSLRRGLAFDVQAGKIFASQAFNDTLYVLDAGKGDELSKILLDFGPAGLEVASSDRQRLSLDDLRRLNSGKSYVYGVDDLFVNDLFTSFSFSYYDNGVSHANQHFYFPQSSKAFTVNRIYNDIDAFNLFEIRQVKGEYLVFDLNPEYLTMIDYEKTSEKFRNTIDFSRSLEDQMVLVFLKFKSSISKKEG